MKGLIFSIIAAVTTMQDVKPPVDVTLPELPTWDLIVEIRDNIMEEIPLEENISQKHDLPYLKNWTCTTRKTLYKMKGNVIVEVVKPMTCIGKGGAVLQFDHYCSLSEMSSKLRLYESKEHAITLRLRCNKVEVEE